MKYDRKVAKRPVRYKPRFRNELEIDATSEYVHGRTQLQDHLIMTAEDIQVKRRWQIRPVGKVNRGRPRQ